MVDESYDIERRTGSKSDADRESDHGRVVRSDDLFRGESELLIEHGDAIYRLRITRGGKLILNK